jgi:magnesium transporter
MYYVGFSSCTILASLILFQGIYDSSVSNTISLVCGFVITFLGVHLLNISRSPEPPLPPTHSALEAGVMNPRLSLQGRMSMDGWGAPAGVGSPLHMNNFSGHPRRTSRGSRGSVLFNAYEDELPPGSANLERLPEEEDDDEADERTRLRSVETGNPRAHRGSPRPSPQLSRSPSYRGD